MRFVMLCVVLVASSSSLAQDQYSVEFEPGLEAVTVRACFEGVAPARLYHGRDASRFIDYFKIGERPLKLVRGRGSSRLSGIRPGACLDWRVNLASATALLDQRLATRVNGDLVSDAGLWLFRGPGERDVEISLTVPKGHQVSAPWRLLGKDSNTFRYRPANTPASWSSRVAIGTFKVQRLDVDGTRVRLAVLGVRDEDTVAKLASWIRQAAAGVADIYGRYPQASPQVIVVPIGPRNEAVPWAHVLRGGGIGAEFFVDETRPLSEFSEDWTACHELSHMLLPFVSGRDRWLSEGLASYYQYVLLSRSGMLSERQAWQGLYEGFERGRKDTRGEPLAEATLKGDWPTMRIYWTGAAMMLLADARLREASGNRQSLDTALAALGDCCMGNDRRWRASEIFAQLDRVTGTSVFSELYEEHVYSHSFPDLASLYASLGIRIRSGSIRLVEPAPLGDVRKSIMLKQPVQ